MRCELVFEMPHFKYEDHDEVVFYLLLLIGGWQNYMEKALLFEEDEPER